MEDYYKNLSGEFTPRPSASEIERLSVDETVATMLAEQRRRKDEAKRLAEEKRKAEEKRLAEIDAKRRDFEVNLKDQEAKFANKEKAPEERNRVGEERKKVEEGQRDGKKQGAGWNPSDADTRQTAEAGWAADGKKAGAEEVMKPQPTDKETNGIAVTGQRAPPKTKKPTKKGAAKTKKPAKQRAPKDSDNHPKKNGCCIIM